MEPHTGKRCTTPIVGQGRKVNDLGYVFIFVSVVVLFLFPIYKMVIGTKEGSRPGELDLTSVRNALMEKQGWSLERAEAARIEYVRFLILLQREPGFMLVPWLNAEGHDDLDQFWHQHILDTAKYAADCKHLFGRMIHHNPHVVRGSQEESEAVEKTRRLYARTFESGSYGRPVDTASLTSCSACATVDAYGHEEAVHDHAGHGDGSHGCGGHSCGHGGGHSCGHGCGHGCGSH